MGKQERPRKVKKILTSKGWGSANTIRRGRFDRSFAVHILLSFLRIHSADGTWCPPEEMFVVKGRTASATKRFNTAFQETWSMWLRATFANHALRTSAIRNPDVSNVINSDYDYNSGQFTSCARMRNPYMTLPLPQETTTRPFHIPFRCIENVNAKMFRIELLRSNAQSNSMPSPLIGTPVWLIKCKLNYRAALISAIANNFVAGCTQR